MKLISSALLLLCSVIAFAQSPKEYFDQKDYQKLSEYDGKEEKLGAEELYYVGFAFFQLENDKKAIEYYDKAIAKGLDQAYIYFYKGLSQRYSKQYKEAINSFNKALSLEPDNQEYRTEKAFVYYYSQQYDSALVHFKNAMIPPIEIDAPFYMVPHIMHMQNDFKGALKGFYENVNKCDPGSEYHLKTLMDIGKLEYTSTHDYKKAAAAYRQVIQREPGNYDLYPKLIKAYYADKNYKSGDSLIAIVKKAYFKGDVSAEYKEFGSIAIDEFDWKGKKVCAYEYFDEPKTVKDCRYKFFVLDETGEKVIDKVLLEYSAISVELGGSKYLVCRSKDGVHSTYAVGFNEQPDYTELQETVIAVLNGKLKPSASSKTK